MAVFSRPVFIFFPARQRQERLFCLMKAPVLNPRLHFRFFLEQIRVFRRKKDAPRFMIYVPSDLSVVPCTSGRLYDPNGLESITVF